MQNILRRFRAFDRDIRLFFLFSLSVSIGFGVFGLAFNLYLIQLGLREDFIGVFNAINTLAIAAGALTMGAVLRRIGTWRALAFGGSGAFVLQLVLAMTEAPPVLLVLSGLYGFTVAYITTTTMPFLIEWSRPAQRARTASIAFALAALAATIGSLLGGFVPEVAAAITGGQAESPLSYRIALITGSLLGAAGLYPLFRMRAARQGKPRDAGRAAPAETDHAARRQTRSDVSIYVLLGGVLALGFGMVIPFYAVYLTVSGIAPGSVGFIYAVGNLLGAVFSLAGPAFVHRYGNLRTNFAMRGMLVPVYLLLLLFPGTWMAVFAHLMRAISLNVGGPLDSTFVADILPPRMQANAIGYRAAAWNVCWSGASISGGWIIVHSGYPLTFAVMVVTVAIASGTFLLYFRRHPLIVSGKVLSALPLRQRQQVATRLAAEAEREAAPEVVRIGEQEAAQLIADPDNVMGQRTTSTTRDLDGHLATGVGVDLAEGGRVADPATTVGVGTGQQPGRSPEQATTS